MPTATSYTSKIRYLSVAKNVKVQLPGGVSNTFRPGLSDMCSDFKTTSPATTTTTGGIITTFAGTGTKTVSVAQNGDRGLAVNATVGTPTCIIADLNGNIFFADTYGSSYTIRKIDTNGFITDTGIRSNLQFLSFTIDRTTGVIYYCNRDAIFMLSYSLESGYSRIQVSSAPTGVFLSHIAFDTSTTPSTFVASTSTNANIYRINIASGLATAFITTIANARVSPSRPITVDSSGNVYVTLITYDNTKKSYTWSVRKYFPNAGVQWTVQCGNATISGTSYATILLNGIAIGPDENVYVSNAITGINFNKVQVIDRENLSRTTVVGGGPLPLFSGDGGLASQSNLNSPAGIAFDSNSNLFICDQLNYRIRKVTPFTSTTIPGKTTYNPPWFTPVEYIELCDCKLLNSTKVEIPVEAPEFDIIYDAQ